MQRFEEGGEAGPGDLGAMPTPLGRLWRGKFTGTWV